jgi:hypothetical protein
LTKSIPRLVKGETSWPVSTLQLPLLRMSLAEPEDDLFRAPVLNELFLDKITQRNIFPDQPATVTLGFLSRTGVREDSVVLASVVPTNVAAPLPADR